MDSHVVKGEDSSIYNGGVLEATIEKAPVLDETHVGVLDQHVKQTEDGITSDRGVVEADVATPGLLDDTHVGVLDSHVVKAENSSSFDRGIVEATIEKAPILDETHVGVLDQHVKKDEDSFSLDQGIVNTIVTNLPIVGDLSIGVLDYHEREMENQSSLSTGLAQIGLNGTLLKDTAVNILRKQEQTTEDGTYTKQSGITLGVTLPILGEVQADILSNETFTSIAIVSPTTQPGTNPDESPNDDSNGTTEPDDNDGQPGTSPEDRDENPALPVVDNEENDGTNSNEGNGETTPIPDSNDTTPPIVDVPEENGNSKQENNNFDSNSEEQPNGMWGDNGSVKQPNADNSDGSVNPNHLNAAGWLAQTPAKHNQLFDANIVGTNDRSNQLAGQPVASNSFEQLPTTGGFLDPALTAILALFLMIGGFTARQWALSKNE